MNIDVHEQAKLADDEIISLGCVDATSQKETKMNRVEQQEIIGGKWPACSGRAAKYVA